ncbi:MAG: MFS transporter [Acidobacteriota bacterium]
MPAASKVSANARLGTFWFIYFAGLGVFFPFYGLYLRQDVGLSGSRVGLVMAAIPLIGLLAQPLWGQVADRTGSRRLALFLVALGVAVVHAGLGFAHGFVPILLGTAVLALFSTPVVPMATAVTLAAQTRHGGSAFGRVRLWGTLGFLAAVVSFPTLRDLLAERFSGPWTGLGWLFPVVAVASFLAAPIALTLPPTAAMVVRSAPGDARKLLRHPPIVRLLIVVFVAHTLVQGPINLFPLLVDARGGDAASIRDLWIFMLLLEVPLIGFSGPALRRLGARWLLVIGLVAEGIRWSVVAWSTDPDWIRWAQMLHGVGVAGIIIGAPLYVELAAPERLRATGQALVATIGFGLGAILSIAGGGWLFEHVAPVAPSAIAGVGALVLAGLVHSILPAPRRPEPETSSDILEGPTDAECADRA